MATAMCSAATSSRSFKGHRLTEITYEAVIRWRDRLRRESEQLNLAAKNGVEILDKHGRPRRPFGPQRVNESLRLLGQILDRAVQSEHYLIDRNPVEGSVRASGENTGQTGA